MPEPTAVSRCPEPTEGTQLLRNEAMGYCLLYPADYTPVDLSYEVCLVPGETFMLCHSAAAFFNVEDAAGRSMSQVADEVTAREAVADDRSSLTVAGEEAVVLPEVPGQASGRVVLFVHDDRLYTLAFGLPDYADPASVARFELLYNTVIDSFALLPFPPRPVPSETTQGTRGSAVVAYIKDGDLLVWEEATGQAHIVSEFDDVVRVEMSDDGRMLAFVRVSPGGEGEALRSSLWVAETSGAGAVELAQDGELRELLGASPSDNVGFHCVEWIPNGHRLVSIGGFGHPWDQGECVGSRAGSLFLFDADTGERIAPPGPPEMVSGILPSPDGEYVAVVTSDGIRLNGLAFLDVDASLSTGSASLRPVAGPIGVRPGELRGWSQDSSAVFVRGPEEAGGGFVVWRVPADGSAAESLISLRGGEDRLAPDGTQMTFRGRGRPFAPTGWFFVPFSVELGPIAAVPVPGYMGFSWSPAGTLYRHKSEALVPLCPEASQVVETCEPSFGFGEPIQWLEWLDRERFLYLTYVPSRLMLGSLDGSTTLIAEDPHASPNASVLTLALSFAAVASTCRDDSEFAADVTVPDGTHVAPDEVFQKIWRIRNTGDCAWDESYRLSFLSGDRLSGPRSAPLGETVGPGEEVDLSVILMTPAEAGTYQGQWQLFAPDGRPFGSSVYVAIVVP
jgi:hypothetical protein